MTIFPFDILIKCFFVAALAGIGLWFAGTTLLPDQWHVFTNFFDTNSVNISWDSVPAAIDHEAQKIQARFQGWIVTKS